MILILDNYDSFVHNLARYFVLAEKETLVVRNDALSISKIIEKKPEAIVISPGPGTPAEAGICVEVIKALGPTTPIFGVCLGHQSIGEAYGGKTVRAAAPRHGKASPVLHDNSALFAGLPSPFKAGRYHSLVTTLCEENTPLVVSAKTREGEIMAMHHRTYPVYGVQFHPESILTQGGLQIVRNFIALAENWNSTPKDKERAA